MEFNKCSRCGAFYTTSNNVCPNCEPKDNCDQLKLRTFLEEKEPIELRDDEQYAMLNVLDYETELDVIELKESFKLGFKEALIYLNNMGMLKLN